MAEQLLHCPDIVSAFEQVGGKAMPERMATCGFGNASCANGMFNGVLQVLFRHVMATFFPAARVDRYFIGGEDILLCPLACGIWIFAMQGGWKINSTASASEVLLVQLFNAEQMCLERLAKALGQERNALTHSLAFAHGNLPIAEVDVLDPQAQTFQKPQAATVEKMDHEAVVALYVSDDRARFGAGKYDR